MKGSIQEVIKINILFWVENTVCNEIVAHALSRIDGFMEIGNFVSSKQVFRLNC